MYIIFIYFDDENWHECIFKLLLNKFWKSSCETCRLISWYTRLPYICLVLFLVPTSTKVSPSFENCKLKLVLFYCFREELHSGREICLSDIKFEQACILYNIGALHSVLGAMDTRQSADVSLYLIGQILDKQSKPKFDLNIKRDYIIKEVNLQI